MKNNRAQILALSGSLRATSTNSAILKTIASFTDEADFVFYNGLGDLPHFNPDADIDPAPANVAHLRGLIYWADGIIICTPEYAFGVPGSLKNALDWMVSTVLLTGKPCALVTASSSGEKAHASLLLTLSALAVNITEETSLLIPYIRTKLNTEGVVTDAETLQDLKNVLTSLLKTINNRTEHDG